MSKTLDIGFSVMIVTRNRRDQLIRTLDHIYSMTPLPEEILVCVDGSDDDTAGIVKANYPSVRLFENVKAIGSVGSRDRLLREARGAWVLSIDDDSYPEELTFFKQAAELIRIHSSPGVFTFPERRNGNTFSQPDKTPDSPARCVNAYANCAALMDRQLYLQQPGFPSLFRHMYEEPDYALQCMAAGRTVWLEPNLVFRHHRDAEGRQQIERHHINARNELCSVWLRCPLLLMPFVIPLRILRQFRHALSVSLSWAIREPLWWCRALAMLPQSLRLRKPVTTDTYWRWLWLSRLQRKTLLAFSSSRSALR